MNAHERRKERRWVEGALRPVLDLDVQSADAIRAGFLGAIRTRTRREGRRGGRRLERRLVKHFNAWWFWSRSATFSISRIDILEASGKRQALLFAPVVWTSEGRLDLETSGWSRIVIPQTAEAIEVEVALLSAPGDADVQCMLSTGDPSLMRTMAGSPQGPRFVLNGSSRTFVAPVVPAAERFSTLGGVSFAWQPVAWDTRFGRSPGTLL